MLKINKCIVNFMLWVKLYSLCNLKVISCTSSVPRNHTSVCAYSLCNSKVISCTLSVPWHHTSVCACMRTFSVSWVNTIVYMCTSCVTPLYLGYMYIQVCVRNAEYAFSVFAQGHLLHFAYSHVRSFCIAVMVKSMKTSFKAMAMKVANKSLKQSNGDVASSKQPAKKSLMGMINGWKDKLTPEPSSSWGQHNKILWIRHHHHIQIEKNVAYNHWSAIVAVGQPYNITVHKKPAAKLPNGNEETHKGKAVWLAKQKKLGRLTQDSIRHIK